MESIRDVEQYQDHIELYYTFYYIIILSILSYTFNSETLIIQIVYVIKKKLKNFTGSKIIYNRYINVLYFC